LKTSSGYRDIGADQCRSFILWRINAVDPVDNRDIFFTIFIVDENEIFEYCPALICGHCSMVAGVMNVVYYLILFLLINMIEKLKSIVFGCKLWCLLIL